MKRGQRDLEQFTLEKNTLVAILRTCTDGRVKRRCSQTLLSSIQWATRRQQTQRENKKLHLHMRTLGLVWFSQKQNKNHWWWSNTVAGFPENHIMVWVGINCVIRFQCTPLPLLLTDVESQMGHSPKQPAVVCNSALGREGWTAFPRASHGFYGKMTDFSSQRLKKKKNGTSHIGAMLLLPSFPWVVYN